MHPSHPTLARLAATAAAVVATAASALAVPAPAAAQQPPAGSAHLSPDLGGVRVEGSAARDATAAYDQTSAALASATATRIAAEAELVALAQRDVELTAEIAAHTARRKDAGIRLTRVRLEIRQIAVSEYVRDASVDVDTRLFDIESSTDAEETHLLGDVVRDNRRAAERAARSDLDEASRAIDLAHDDRIAVRTRTVEVTAVRDQATADEARLTTELGVRLFELEQARSTSRVSGTDFTLVALDAYWRAAQGASSCGISWWALAGISRVEGRHGTYGGSSLMPNGDVTRRIIGIPLTGANNTASIPDSDGGALDGDTTYDRAVGPMQFIPQTWARWARDGDGDGDRDPQNMYDATAAAAAYLCHGGPMRTDSDLRRGYFSYNHSEAYVEAVLAHAHAYSRFRIPAPPPPPPVAAIPPT